MLQLEAALSIVCLVGYGDTAYHTDSFWPHYHISYFQEVSCMANRGSCFGRDLSSFLLVVSGSCCIISVVRRHPAGHLEASKYSFVVLGETWDL